jgi:hypothetical protein
MRLLPRNIGTERVTAKSIDRPEVLRRYEITVEREYLSVKCQPGQGFTARCAECGHDVTMLSPDAAAEAAGTTSRIVYRWVEEKRVHFIEPGSGKVFICSESLQQHMRCQQIALRGACELRELNPSQLPGPSR